MVISNPLSAEWIRISATPVPVTGKHQHHIPQNTSSYTATNINITDTISDKLLNISTYQMCLEPRMA